MNNMTTNNKHWYVPMLFGLIINIVVWCFFAFLYANATNQGFFQGLSFTSVVIGVGFTFWFIQLNLSEKVLNKFALGLSIVCIFTGATSLFLFLNGKTLLSFMSLCISFWSFSGCCYRISNLIHNKNIALKHTNLEIVK
jgi:hypothetical protein